MMKVTTRQYIQTALPAGRAFIDVENEARHILLDRKICEIGCSVCHAPRDSLVLSHTELVLDDDFGLYMEVLVTCTNCGSQVSTEMLGAGGVRLMPDVELRPEFLESLPFRMKHSLDLAYGADE